MKDKLEKLNELEKQYLQSLEEIKKLKGEFSKPKFEVGKWYKFKSGVVNYQDKENSYGIFYDRWHDVICFDGKEKAERQATDEEVFEALKKEAEKKTNGASKIKVKSIKDGIIYTFENYHFELYNNILQIWGSNGWISLMEDGKWATIIKDESINIGGYEVKYEKIIGLAPTYKIGCKLIYNAELEAIRNFMKRSKFYKISINDIEVDLDTIEKILALKEK